jgi:hypothetical protein
VLVQDTTDYAHWNEESKMSKAQAQRDYAEIIARSHFALSPRGAGFGSIRLFEVMEMGVAPVLLSDRYALPKGPDWDGFLIRVREADYARLPEILEARVAESEERGRKARQAWETFFAPEVAFNRLIEQLVEIRQSRGVPEKLMQKLWPMMQASADARAGLASTVRAAIAAPRRLLRGTR